MQFRAPTTHSHEEPSINLIALIDVLLVVVIFLLLTTTYNRPTHLQITLPQSHVGAHAMPPQRVIVEIDRQGHYVVNAQRVDWEEESTSPVQTLSQVLRQTVQALSTTTPSTESGQTGLTTTTIPLLIQADGQASHQTVVWAMEAARAAGLDNITFATQRLRSRR
jgi:biopolymer transport protein ExbD